MSTVPAHRPRGRRSAPSAETAAPWSSLPPQSEPGSPQAELIPAQPSSDQAPAALSWRTPQEYFRQSMGSSPLILLLGALLIMESPVPLVPVALPISETIMGVLILGALLRTGRLRPARMPVIVVLLSAAFLWMLVVSIQADVEWTRRMIRVGLLFASAVILATGRVPVRPLVLGMFVGLLVNAVLFYAGVAPDYYQGALTGYLLDKNVAGFVYAIVPLLVVPFLSRRWLQALVLIVGLVLVFQTGSRTGLAAMILATGWMLLAGRGGPFLRGGLLVAIYMVFIWAEENLASLDVFGDRTGTDWFRGRIDEAAWDKTVGAMPWGEGAGQAFILLPPEQQPFFFHNSFWALIVEGGIPLLVMIVAAFLIGGFGLGAAIRPTPAASAAQASILVLFLVSFRLGEVFLTVPAMICLGSAMAIWELERRRLRQEAAHRRRQVLAAAPDGAGESSWLRR